jgi:hypothetical protein
LEKPGGTNRFAGYFFRDAAEQSHAHISQKGSSMSDPIKFVRNHSDHSTDNGFQFEFYCDRCGSGYRSRFQNSVTSAVSGILDTASNIFGGIFGSAAHVGDRVRSASWQRDRDNAFEKAVDEILPQFAQCPHCSAWVCRDSCWNTERGLCKNCSPDLAVEMSAAQSSRTREAIWDNAEVAEEDQGKIAAKEFAAPVKASCPNCEAPLAENVKFCPDCGTRIDAQRHCTNCGAKLQQKAKFCADCGEKVSS